MLRAVPATILIADSTVKQFKSVILSVAIACTCSQVTLAIFTLFGSGEPNFFLLASNNCIATGGVLTIKSKDLSE